MRKTILVCLVAFGLMSPVAAKDAQVMGVAEMNAAAPSLTTNGRSGRYAITVASTGHSDKATFLNSTDDYKSAGNITFSIAPIVVNTLTKRYSASPEEYFKGKTVTVDGILRREPIVASFSGRAHHFERYQLTVRIEQASQIVAIS